MQTLSIKNFCTKSVPLYFLMMLSELLSLLHLLVYRTFLHKVIMVINVLEGQYAQDNKLKRIFTDNLIDAMLMRWAFRFQKACYVPLRCIMLTITIAKNMNGLIIERELPPSSLDVSCRFDKSIYLLVLYCATFSPEISPL